MVSVATSFYQRAANHVFFYPLFNLRNLLYLIEEQYMRNDGTPGYYEALRLRKIYCEGNFSHQKAEHNLRRLRKRGLGKAHEHCLLSATALNLKRMVKLLTTRKHPGVSLRKTLSAIGYSMELRPMALLSTGPKRYTPLTGRREMRLPNCPGGNGYCVSPQPLAFREPPR